MSVTYTASLTVREQTVLFVSSLLHAERRRRGTRTGTRALGCFAQAVLVLRWFLDGTRLAQLATDNAIGKSTAYDYLHEGINVLAARAPKLESALLAAKIAGHPHVDIDGTLIEIDRCAAPGPTPGVDLWWSGKHNNHGGNIQVVTAPDGWPLWTSQVRPGREHDTTALREHTEILPLFVAWTEDHLRVLGDLGYEGEADTITVAFKKPKGGELSDTHKTYNKVHNGIRAIGERGNSLLKMTFKALRNVSLCPWTIGRIVAAALVSGVLGAAVVLADPQDPATARINPSLREHARALVLAGRVKNVSVTRDNTAQQEGPVRSTVRHNPATGTGHDGSPRARASAGQGERPAQPRHRPHTRGRRRTGRTGHTPPIHKPPGL